MQQTTLIKKALTFAEKAHKSQFRKGLLKEPYVKHPIRVAQTIKKYKKSHRINELVAAALLHDVLEDTNASEREIKKIFGKLVLSLVKELTSEAKYNETKKKYLAEKMQKMSNWGLVIKLADRLDNVSDLFDMDKKFARKYASETKYILDRLEKNRKLTKTQRKLVEKIREKFR